MTFLFAFQASKSLTEEFNEVLNAFANGIPAQPQAGAVVSLAQRYADEIVDALVVNLMKGSSPSSSAPKVLETVASVIKGASHTHVGEVGVSSCIGAENDVVRIIVSGVSASSSSSSSLSSSETDGVGHVISGTV